MKKFFHLRNYHVNGQDDQKFEKLVKMRILINVFNADTGSNTKEISFDRVSTVLSGLQFIIHGLVKIEKIFHPVDKID